MLKKVTILFITVSSIFLLISKSYAFGIGAYGTLGGGNTMQNIYGFSIYVPGTIPIQRPKHYRNLAIGGGVVIDSCLAALDIFNYRLKIGLEENKLNRETELKLTRLHLDQIFGFALVRASVVRWWLGPLLEARYSWGDNQGYLSDITQYGGAAGVATGINLNPVDHFTIGLEGGFKYGLDWGSQKWSSKFNFVPLTKYVLGKSTKLRSRGYELYGAVSVFYRVGDDTYSRIRYEKAKE